MMGGDPLLSWVALVLGFWGCEGKNVDPNGKKGNLITRRFGARTFSDCLDCREHEIVKFRGARKDSRRVETLGVKLVRIDCHIFFKITQFLPELVSGWILCECMRLWTGILSRGGVELHLCMALVFFDKVVLMKEWSLTRPQTWSLKEY